MDVLAGDIEIHLPPDDDDDNPHVRVVGRCMDSVRVASSLVRQELEPANKVTMKMDVPWNHHSHIIGKAGNTIQPVVKKTGVSIHFPDGNKNNEMKKSNQVSINSRGEDLHGLEEARDTIRSLTPIIFTFTLLSSVQFVSVVDANMLLLHVQNTYNVQVELRALEDRTLVGSVRGSEFEIQQVKKATQCILQAYCTTLAGQVPIQVSVEISPQHHAFVLGRNNENVRRIMHKTSTKIVFPDWNDTTLSPLKKSTVLISGALDNVHLALHNIIGCLPLVLMFDLMPGSALEMSEVAQMMQVLDVQIILKSCKVDGRRCVIVKGQEKNAENIYEAWKMLCKVNAPIPKANIPATYHLHEPINKAQTNGISLGVNGQWVGGGGGGVGGVSTSLPSPTTPTTPQYTPHTSLWGGLTHTVPPPPSPLLPPITTRSYPDHTTTTTTTTTTSNSFYGSFFHNGGLPYNNNNSNNNLNNLNLSTTTTTTTINNAIRKDTSMISQDAGSGGNGSSGGGLNLYSLVKSMKAMEVNKSDASYSASSNSGSSLSSSVAHSPRDVSPDPHPAVFTSSSTSPFMDSSTSSPHHQNIDALSTLIDRRAPGCEKKHIERVVAQKWTLSDYTSKKIEAAIAMKQDVGSTPRTPTSSWSGYGFSKSMPGFVIRQKLQQLNGGMISEGDWKDSWQDNTATGGTTNNNSNNNLLSSSSSSSNSSSPPSPPFSSTPTVKTVRYHPKVTQYGLSNKMVPFSACPSINLSASNYMDSVLPRRERDLTTTTNTDATYKTNSSQTTQNPDIISILTDLQLPQYIDMFVGQEIDTKMFLSLEDYELKELGITIFGHRKRIRMAIKDLSSKNSLFVNGTTRA